jgi:hypothetical protein
MRGARGYGIVVDPDPGRGMPSVQEYDIAQCSHCDRVIKIAPGIDVHRCTCCDALICTQCVGKGCDHIEKKLARWEAQARFFQALGA